MTYIRERERLAVRGGWREEAVQSVSFKLWGTVTWCVWGSGLPWRRADVALWAGSGRGEAEISFKKRKVTKLQNCWKQQCGLCKLQSKSDSESLLFLLFLSTLWEAVIYVMHLKTFCKPCLSPKHRQTQIIHIRICLTLHFPLFFHKSQLLLFIRINTGWYCNVIFQPQEVSNRLQCNAV